MDAGFLDCKRLNCPMPIVRLSQAFRALRPGDSLMVEADDPAFGADLQAWAHRFGHKIVTFQAGAVQRAVVEKR
jgi:tRNA 2-thiouridine synthesizing protein A